MEIVKISKWVKNNCKVNLSKTQIIRLNHLGKKGILIGNECKTHSINLFYKNVSFLELLFDEDYDPEYPVVKLSLPAPLEGVDSIHMMNEAKYNLEKEYNALVRRYKGINQRSENAYVIPFDDLEYHVDIFIDAVSHIADPNFDFESYGWDEIGMNQKLLLDKEGRLTGQDAEYKTTKRIGNNILYFGVLEIHEKKCMICDSVNESLIDVCRIKPWSESKNDKHERTDKFNGLTLCKNHHKLFDDGYFTIDERNKVVVSDKLSELDMNLFFDKCNSTVALSSESQFYLKWHRDNRYIK